MILSLPVAETFPMPVKVNKENSITGTATPASHIQKIFCAVPQPGFTRDLIT
ncbi:MAG: hypothetical protein GX334_00390 [Firmicutes bacterium]|nr:hypothetical protein [Bacillota bacterium]